MNDNRLQQTSIPDLLKRAWREASAIGALYVDALVSMTRLHEIFEQEEVVAVCCSPFSVAKGSNS